MHLVNWQDHRSLLLLLIGTLHTVGSSIDSVHLSLLPSSQEMLNQPIFASPAQFYQEPQGGEVVLYCEVLNLNDNNVVWKQGERVISAGNIMTRVDKRMSLIQLNFGSHPTNLRIKRLKLSDAGNYTCEVEWPGAPLSVTHSLTVLQPPVITRPQSGANFHATQGEELTVACKATGDPQPQVWWSKVNKKGLQRLVLPDDTSYLHLRGVDRDDTGEYVCQAKNKISTAEVNIHLQIHFLPEVKPLHYRVYSGEGAKTELGCLVEGYPEPMVSWYYLSGGREIEVRHDQNHLTARQGGTLHKLTIRNLSYIEIANFTCKAENEVGLTRGHIEVTGIPQPPTINSEPESLYHNQYNLVFTVKSHEPLVQVKLKYKQQGESSLEDFSESYIERWFTPGNLKTRQRMRPTVVNRVIEYEIGNLNRSSSYSLLVSVMNKHGWSDQSNMFTFRTRNQDYTEDRPRSFFDFQSSSTHLQSGYLVFLVIVCLRVSQIFSY